MNRKAKPVGRPREFEEADVMDVVMKLFWKNGYEGTALSDILTATGLTKGSIYKAFQSKHKLYLKSLERYEEIHIDKAAQALISKGTPLTRIDNFLSAPVKDISKKEGAYGCFLCNSSADQAASDPATRALVQRGFEKLAKALTVAVTEMKPGWNTKRKAQVTESLLAVYSGLRIMSRSGVSVQKLEAAKSGGLLLLI